MLKKYKHYKNQKLYYFLEIVLIQINNEWKEAVLYTDENKELKFVREKEEFYQKFNKL